MINWSWDQLKYQTIISKSFSFWCVLDTSIVCIYGMCAMKQQREKERERGKTNKINNRNCPNWMMLKYHIYYCNDSNRILTIDNALGVSAQKKTWNFIARPNDFIKEMNFEMVIQISRLNHLYNMKAWKIHLLVELIKCLRKKKIFAKMMESSIFQKNYLFCHFSLLFISW